MKFFGHVFPWAQRLKRVFRIDIETCEDCGGAVRVIACIEDPVVIEKIPTHVERREAVGALTGRTCRGVLQDSGTTGRAGKATKWFS